MSSGVEADIALDAAVVLTLGMNRLLGRGAGWAGRGAEALAAAAAARAEARAAELAEAGSADAAVQAVLDRLARLAALAETRAKTGADVELPAPLEPAGQSPDELRAWCAATDAAMDAAERALSEHVAAQVAAHVFGAAAEGLRTDLGAPAAPDAPAADARGVQEALERVLARLLPDVAEDDRRAVAEAARLAAEAATPEEAEGVLTEVRLRIQDANGRTRDERERAAAAEAAARAEDERRYVLDSVTEAFTDLGYEVHGGFETLTADAGELVLTRGGWPDHSVRMRVEGGGQVRAAMTRTAPAESEDDRRLDVEREREWCAAFEAARDRLAGAGIGSAVTWRLDPGVRELPVAAEKRQTGPRATPRERHRERGR
ncbi:response regulator receiver protein [Actinomadura parmotrematis]|uniref:Response regulator receiver protein n=1 Tax=Actinomadura parmotrematis TaxID=2864039 RepID=A0ABS7FM81_9ACTN|nr:response regulator receiver protein [Actinomadura parmotrematis]MBW8481483.1 response regulator receiver protein [Actinomadura parmotrematis]